MPFKVPEIGPYSAPAALAKLDQRTKEARLMHETRTRLIRHLGGKPSAVQLALVDRAARLTLHVALFDGRTLETGGALSERDTRSYLAYSNSLSRVLRQLGLEGSAAKGITATEYLAAKRRASSPEEVA